MTRICHSEMTRMCDSNVCWQLAAGERGIFGVMVESHINEGRQDLVEGQADKLK